MRLSLIALVGLPMLLVSPQSVAFAQTAREAVAMPTGDVWALREEYLYMPREAVELPQEHTRSEMATGDLWALKGQQAPRTVDDQVQGRSTR
jgi:hypothetical protein